MDLKKNGMRSKTKLKAKRKLTNKTNAKNN